MSSSLRVAEVEGAEVDGRVGPKVELERGEV
jgi:hypothetical protein